MRGSSNEVAHERLRGSYSSDADLLQRFDSLSAGRLRVLAGAASPPLMFRLSQDVLLIYSHAN